MDSKNTTLYAFNTIKLICDGDSKIPFNIKNNKINLYCQCLIVTSQYLPLNILLDHCNKDITKVDFDLFDAITRRIELRFIGFDSRSVQVFKEKYKEQIDLLRNCFGNKEVSK